MDKAKYLNIDDALKELTKQSRERSLTIDSFITILSAIKVCTSGETKVSGISSYSVSLCCTKATEKVDDEYVIKKEVVLNL